MAAAKLLSAVVDKHAHVDGLTDGQGGNPSYLALEDRDRLLVRAILHAAAASSPHDRSLDWPSASSVRCRPKRRRLFIFCMWAQPRSSSSTFPTARPSIWP